ncbi:MAG: PEP-utilizing enzyme [Candidatus Altiarchaeota archaeon]
MDSYTFMWGQRQSAMVAECMLRLFSDYNSEFTMTAGVDDVFREHTNGFSYIYYSKEALRNVNKNGEKYLDRTQAKKIFKRLRDTKSKAMRFYRRVARLDYGELSDKEILGIVKEYQSHLIWMNKVYRTSDPSSTGALEAVVRKTLSTRYRKGELTRNFGILMTSTKLDRSQQELIHWCRLTSRGKRVTDRALMKHAMRYPEKYANAWSRDEITGFLRSRMEQTSPESLSEEITAIKKFKTVVRKKQDRIYSEFKDEPTLKYYCEMLQDLGLSRFDLKEAWGGAETMMLDFLTFLAKRIGLDMASFMAAYNFTDLINFFEKGKRLTGKEIKDRTEYSILHYKGGRLRYLCGQEARDHYRQFHTSPTDVTELRGMTANPGKVIGPVRIVRVDNLARLAQDMKAFKPGEILVTTMTSPLIIPIAVKAAAIVTNQGGICSHAAVISREFDIPCIVGTHDATRVFKDGDLVEVDAERGIVSKIN